MGLIQHDHIPRLSVRLEAVEGTQLFNYACPGGSHLIQTIALPRKVRLN